MMTSPKSPVWWPQSPAGTSRSIGGPASTWKEIRQAPSWLRTVLARGHYEVWVADSGENHLFAYLWARLHRDRSGYLPRRRGYVNHAFLEENWRGREIMRSMMETAYEWFRSKEITMVTLTVLHRNRVGSSAWYKLGYEDLDPGAAHRTQAAA